MARRSLPANIATSGANVLVVVGASLLAVPLLIDRLGLAAYGIWSLAQTLVIYVTTAEAGFGPALARFTSVHSSDRDGPRRVLFTALAIYAVVGLLIVAMTHLLAGPLVEFFKVPQSLHDDAVATVGIVGWVALVTLIGAALGHVLMGLERAFTLTNAAGSAAFLVAIVFLLGDRAKLQDVAYAALLQWGVVAVLRVATIRGLLLRRGPIVPGRALIRDLLGFSARLQVAVLATLLNTQTDRVVVARLASATTLGQVSIATQVAEAARFLVGSVFIRWRAAWRSRTASRGNGRSTRCCTASDASGASPS